METTTNDLYKSCKEQLLIDSRNNMDYYADENIRYGYSHYPVNNYRWKLSDELQYRGSSPNIPCHELNKMCKEGNKDACEKLKKLENLNDY